MTKVSFGVLVVLFAAAACQEVDDEPAGPYARPISGGPAAGADGGAISCTMDVPSQVLAPSCGTAGCHAAQSPADALDLASPGVAARIVGKPAVSGGLLADPAHAEDSVIYRRLLGQNGPRMPSGAAPLDAHTTACVLAWIRTLSPTPGGSTATTPSGSPNETPSGSPTGSPPAFDAGAGTNATPTSTRPTIRVAAGASAPYTDQSGQTWSADVGFDTGQVTVNSPPIAIAQTNDDVLYNQERWGGDAQGNLIDFHYAFAVPDGAYTVTLKFAETYSGAMGVGLRRFDVAIGGVKMLSDFDIYAAAGPNTAIDKSFDVDAKGGTLTIDFLRGAALTPKVDAIAIVPR